MTNDVGYAPVNGLRMYYEIHGAGEPLVARPAAPRTRAPAGDRVGLL
jgi:hypothetical protein